MLRISLKNHNIPLFCHCFACQCMLICACFQKCSILRHIILVCMCLILSVSWEIWATQFNSLSLTLWLHWFYYHLLLVCYWREYHIEGGEKVHDKSLKESTIFVKATIIIKISLNPHNPLDFNSYCYNWIKTVLTGSSTLIDR